MRPLGLASVLAVVVSVAACGDDAVGGVRAPAADGRPNIGELLPDPVAGYFAFESQSESGGHPVGYLGSPGAATHLFLESEQDMFEEALVESRFEEGWSAAWEREDQAAGARLFVLRFADEQGAIAWAEDGADEPIENSTVERAADINNARIVTTTRSDGDLPWPYVALVLFREDRDVFSVLVDGESLDGVRDEALRIARLMLRRAESL